MVNGGAVIMSETENGPRTTDDGQLTTANRQPAKSTRIERLFVPGPAGRLEALLEWIPDAQPGLAALVCHPHPLYGGTMHTKAVFRAAKAALSLGLPTLRFNFRGVGQSEGVFDEGIGERDDARAALDFLNQRFADLPQVCMGFSFGSWVGLSVGAADSRVRALVGLGLPADSYDFSFLMPVTKPKLIVQGSEDVHGPRDRVMQLFSSLAEPKEIHWVEGADHFFTGRLDEEQRAIRDFVAQLLNARASML
jgi:alpha/beta superfamily hydrolase